MATYRGTAYAAALALVLDSAAAFVVPSSLPSSRLRPGPLPSSSLKPRTETCMVLSGGVGKGSSPPSPGEDPALAAKRKALEDVLKGGSKAAKDWRPVKCVSCAGSGTCECGACEGTAFMMIGEKQLCGVDGKPIPEDAPPTYDTADMEFRADDVVCQRGLNYRESRNALACRFCDEGEVKCEKCSGTGRISAWMQQQGPDASGMSP